MYDLFLIKTYELLSVFSHDMTDYLFGNILKCDKCVKARIEIHKLFRLWYIVVHFLKQTKAQG